RTPRAKRREIKMEIQVRKGDPSEALETDELTFDLSGQSPAWGTCDTADQRAEEHPLLALQHLYQRHLVSDLRTDQANPA
ncbi:unnamed protein product, partial [Gadus morhua 'NCC']